MFAGILRWFRPATASRTLERGPTGSGRGAGREERFSPEELAAGLAHEIKEPLSSVLGYSQALLAEDLPQDIRAGLQMIYSEANRAASIVHNLISFAGGSEPVRMRMDVTSVLNQALDIKSHDFQAANIAVTRGFSEALPWAALDGQQLLQVFLNVLNNAEHAIRPARGSGHLAVGTAAAGDRIRIVFTDDGPGIAPGDLPRVFEPFFTTRAAGEGTGLGLSISRRIVRRHGGDIWAESTPGQGATFYIELPVAGSEDVQPTGGDGAGPDHRL